VKIKSEKKQREATCGIHCVERGVASISSVDTCSLLNRGGIGIVDDAFRYFYSKMSRSTGSWRFRHGHLAPRRDGWIFLPSLAALASPVGRVHFAHLFIRHAAFHDPFHLFPFRMGTYTAYGVRSRLRVCDLDMLKMPRTAESSNVLHLFRGPDGGPVGGSFVGLPFA
jgi:hypothetical protein